MPKPISKAQAIEKLNTERRRLEQNLGKLSQAGRKHANPLRRTLNQEQEDEK